MTLCHQNILNLKNVVLHDFLKPPVPATNAASMLNVKLCTDHMKPLSVLLAGVVFIQKFYCMNQDLRINRAALPGSKASSCDLWHGHLVFNEKNDIVSHLVENIDIRIRTAGSISCPQLFPSCLRIYRQFQVWWIESLILQESVTGR